MGAGFRLAAAAVVLAVATAWAPAARADDLTDQRDTVNAQLQQAQQDINQSSAALAAAVARLEQSQAQLLTARSALASAEAELAGARAKDAAAAGALASATLRAEVAGTAVAQGQADIAEQRTLVGEVARDTYQQNTALVGIATLFTAKETGQLNDRLQWTSTMADATQAQITRLEDLQAGLAAARNWQGVLEAQALTVRDEAAARLAATRRAEEKARTAAAAVTAAVAANESAKSAADRAVADDKAQYAALQVESAAVNQRIAERAAAQRAAEEAARRAAEEAARRAAAASQSAQSAQAAAQAVPAAPVPVSTASKGLALPVSAPVTSSYGMRLHPILGYWKLHDGTDFGAACGTPIRAAASGVISEKYFNAGYGNRLFIDHGSINDRIMTTAYNHLSGYAVSVGQRVSQGQIVGYVGTTGYSTGCHLHLMLWVNGSMVDPMRYF